MNKFNIHTENINEIIWQFLKGELTEEDHIEFNKALAADEKLKEEVDFVRSMYFSFSDQERDETKGLFASLTADIDLQENPDALKELEASFDAPPPGPLSGMSSILKIFMAGLVIVGICLLTWFYFAGNRAAKVYHQLYEDYYVPYDLVESIDPNSKTPEDLALGSYSKKQYDTVISYLGENTANTAEMDLLMALSIAYIETGDFVNAEKTLTIISKDTRDVYADDAVWYLAMCKIKQGNSIAARQHLNNLIEHDSYGKQAKAILELMPNN